MRIRFMKKGLLIIGLVILALALVSCGNKEEPEATEQPGPAVQSVGVGDRITTDFIDLTIEQAGTVDKIKPSDPDPTSLFVISKAPGTDETYFCVTGLVKNIGRDAYNLGDIFVKISFDGTYNYSGYVTADTGRDLSDWPELKPLASVRYYFYTPVPNEMIESFSTVTVRFAFNDNLKTGRKKDISAYDHGYEIALSREKTAPVVVEEVGPSFTAVGIGESIVTGFVEMTIEEAAVTDTIRSSGSGGAYGFYPSRYKAEDGSRYFHITGMAKNTGGESYTFGNFSVRIIFDDEKTYNGSFLADIGEGLSFEGKRLAPRESVRYYLYASVPDEVLDSYSACKVQFGFHDNFSFTSYVSNLKAYENCYEISLGRVE